MRSSPTVWQIILLAIWNYRCMKTALPSSSVSALSMIFILLTAGLSGYHAIQSFTETNTEMAELRSAIAPVTDQSCILLRNRRSAYEYVPEVSQFDNCQVITISSENWESLTSDEMLEDEMILIACGIDRENLPKDWFNEKQYQLLSPIYESDGLTIIPIRR